MQSPRIQCVATQARCTKHRKIVTCIRSIQEDHTITTEEVFALAKILNEWPKEKPIYCDGSTSCIMENVSKNPLRSRKTHLCN